MAPWPHVQFKASPSLRIQWPFNCCNISLLSWHWSILKHLPWNSVLSRPWRSIHRWSGLPLIHVNFGGPIEAKAGCFWKMLKVQFYHFIYVLVCLFKYTVHVCIYIYIVVWIYLYWCTDCIVAKAKRHATTQPQLLPTESVPESSTQPQGDEIKPRTEWKM